MTHTRPTKRTISGELSVDPLLQPTPAVARLAIAEGWQQELSEASALAELMHRAYADTEHPRDDRHGTNGRQNVANLKRAIRNVEAARTTLRLHTLVLIDLLREH